MNNKFGYWTILVIIILISCGGGLGACMQSSSTSTIPTLQPSPTSSLPNFLYHIHPEPGELVIQGGRWGISIGATLNAEEIAEVDDTFQLEDMQERVNIYLDSEKQSKIEFYQGLRPGQVQVVGDFSLDSGEHNVTIEIQKSSDEMLNYSWEFFVIDEEPTIHGLPDGFQFVRPLPDSVISLQSYHEEMLVPKYYFPEFADLRGGVCVGILTDMVVERGELLDSHPVGKKYSFVSLDGIHPDSNSIVEGGTEASKNQFYEDGELIRSYGGPHHYKCWRVDLTPGEHKATVQMDRSSGTIEYTWAFTITNN